MSWAGQYIAAVHIDNYGKFPFILAKVSDRTTAHRLLVRGRNAADKATLMRALTTEVGSPLRRTFLHLIAYASSVRGSARAGFDALKGLTSAVIWTLCRAQHICTTPSFLH